MLLDLEPRPLADLEQDAVARVEAEMARRARGAKLWTPTECVDEIEKVHVRSNHRRRAHEQETTS